MSFRNPQAAYPASPSPRTPVVASPGTTAQVGKRNVAQTSLGVACVILCLYLFLVYSRLPEVIAALVGNLHLPLLLMAACAVTMLSKPALRQTLASGPGLLILAFTGWMVISVPMSVWRSGSLSVLISEWPTPLVTFFIAASLISTLRHCEAMVNSIAMGVLMLLLIYVIFGTSFYGRTGMSIGGTLGNANLLALQLLFGLPFCLFGIYRFASSAFYGGLSVLVLFAGLYVVGTTGSRSGLLALIAISILIFLRASPKAKGKILFLFLLLALAAPVLLPQSVRERYLTMVYDDPRYRDDAELVSAIDSANARRHHLRQSMELTFKNPIFGVGPGVFMVAAAELSSDKNEHAAWLETHNSYTQVSSEMGIPAFILYFSLLVVSVKRLYTLMRNLRKYPRLTRMADATFCLQLSLIATMINAFFASIAYQIYFPLLCGLAVGFCRIGNELLNQAALTDGTTAKPSVPAWTLPTISLPGLRQTPRPTGSV